MSDFLSSLALILIGALLTGLLIPYITRQWQLQQRATEVKSELIEDITELATEMFMEVGKPIAFRTFPDYLGPTTDIATKVFGWEVRSEVIASLLNLYFREVPLAEKWAYISNLHIQLAMLSSLKSPGIRYGALQKLKTTLGKERASYVEWNALIVAATEASIGAHTEAFFKAQNALILIIKLERNELVESIFQSRTHGEFSIVDYFK